MLIAADIYSKLICTLFGMHALILGHYCLVMSMGQLLACQNKAEIHIMNNLLISNVQSLWENLEPGPCRIDQVIMRSIQQFLGEKFSVKASLLVNK